MQLIAAPGAFCPALATLIVRKWITREGFGDLKLSFRSGRWAFYLAAWLLPLVVIAIMSAEALAAGLGAPDFTLATAVAVESKERSIGALQGMGLLIVPQAMLAALVFILSCLVRNLAGAAISSVGFSPSGPSRRRRRRA